LCAFGLHTGILQSKEAVDYRWKTADEVLWLDARVLPRQVGISLGLVEVGGYAEMLPLPRIQEIELRSVHIITSTVPWIYLQVLPIVNPLFGDG
jgi:hypothetical protein